MLRSLPHKHTLTYRYKAFLSSSQPYQHSGAKTPVHMLEGNSFCIPHAMGLEGWVKSQPWIGNHHQIHRMHLHAPAFFERFGRSPDLHYIMCIYIYTYTYIYICTYMYIYILYIYIYTIYILYIYYVYILYIYYIYILYIYTLYIMNNKYHPTSCTHSSSRLKNQ